MNGSRMLGTLFILTLVAGLTLWSLMRLDVGAPHGGMTEGRPLVDWPLDDIEFLMLERETLRLECRRGPRGWRLVSPIEARADATRIQRILDSLESARVEERITARQMAARGLSLQDFGLVSPSARVVLGERVHRTEWLFGHKVPVGSHLFVTGPQSPDVEVVDLAVLDAWPDDLESMRDRRLLWGDGARVIHVELRRPGAPFVQLAREGRAWRMIQPVEARADAQVMERLLKTLFDAEVTQFVWPLDPSADIARSHLRERQMVYGLDRDDSVVQVYLREIGDPLGIQLRIGLQRESDDGSLYAVVSGDSSIVAVPTNIVSAVHLSVDDLRDRRVFDLLAADVLRIEILRGADRLVLQRSTRASIWRLMQPVQDRADSSAVAGLLQVLAGLRCDGFREAPDATPIPDTPAERSILLTTADQELKLEMWRSADQDMPWVGRMADVSSALLFASESFPEVLRDAPRALDFRDKTLMAVPTESMLRLRREGTSGVQVFERTPSGAWAAQVALPAMLDAEAFDHLVFLLAHLRAERVETVMAEDLTAYGLHEPRLKLTVETTEGDAPRKTLLLGEKTPGGGCYAMLRGHDVVFVLDAGQASVLEQPLIR